MKNTGAITPYEHRNLYKELIQFPFAELLSNGIWRTKTARGEYQFCNIEDMEPHHLRRCLKRAAAQANTLIVDVLTNELNRRKNHIQNKMNTVEEQQTLPLIDTNVPSPEPTKNTTEPSSGEITVETAVSETENASTKPTYSAGQTVGHFTILDSITYRSGGVSYVVKCVCGKIGRVARGHLAIGLSSCGCVRNTTNRSFHAIRENSNTTVTTPTKPSRKQFNPRDMFSPGQTVRSYKILSARSNGNGACYKCLNENTGNISWVRHSALAKMGVASKITPPTPTPSTTTDANIWKGPYKVGTTLGRWKIVNVVVCHPGYRYKLETENGVTKTIGHYKFIRYYKRLGILPVFPNDSTSAPQGPSFFSRLKTALKIVFNLT